MAVVFLQDAGAQRGEACDLGVEGVTSQVEMDAVLDGLRLADQLEKQTRTRARCVDAICTA